MHLFYQVSKLTVKVVLFLFTRWQVRGRENVPGEGPVLVVANHLSLADPPVVGISLGRKVIFMAKEELFRSKFIGHFVREFGSFPVHRGQLDKKTLSQVKQVLANGLALAMFPEGTRSKNAQLQLAYSGSSLVAARSGVPILPVGITGTERIRGLAWLLHRPRLMVSIGRPFHLPPIDGKLTKEELARSTTYIMERIAELLPAEYRGHYAGTRNQSDVKD